MTSADADEPPHRESTESTVRLVGDEWVAVNSEDATITHHAASLPDLLAVHRHAVAFRIGKDLTVRYLLGGPDTAERIARIRTAGEHIAALRREANRAEAVIRSDRTALMRELAGLAVIPGEIAQILGIPTTAVPKDLGTDRDARLARYLATHALPPDDPTVAGRLF